MPSCFSDNAVKSVVKKPEDFRDLSSWIMYLSELEQEEPENYYIELSLARAYVVMKDWTKAELYIHQAEKHMPKRSRKEIVYEIFAYKAQLLYKKADFAGSLSYIEKAIEEDNDDPMLLSLTKANILTRTDTTEAKKIYDGIWSSEANSFSQEDVESYFQLLISVGQWDRALDVLEGYFDNNGYQDGLGLHFSIVYENLKLFPESIVSIFTELLNKRDNGIITTESLIKGMKAVNEKTQNNYKALIDALISISSFDFGDLDKLQANVISDNNSVFIDMLAAQIALKLNPSDDRTLQKYVELEWKYRSFASYYYVLWTSMKEGQVRYSINRVQGVLEKIIALNPSSDVAIQSRLELGRLLGLNVHESAKLLIGPEIDNLAYRYATTRDFEVLNPALQMLELQNNEYTQAVVNMFTEFVKIDPKVSEYLKQYNGNKEAAVIRIENILSN